VTEYDEARTEALVRASHSIHASWVAPYCHGFTNKGEVLRGIQVGGESHSGALDSGKLWLVNKIENLRRTGEPFVPSDPHYNPRDSAMTKIHCNVRR
jgi:hypothetical protein